MMSAESSVHLILKRINSLGARAAVYERGRTVTYADLGRRIEHWRSELRGHGVLGGEVFAVVADFSLESIALVLAALAERVIVVPFTRAVEVERHSLASIAGVRWTITLDEEDRATWSEVASRVPDIVQRFRARRTPGLIVFTSGSTGKPKGILHDCERVLDKFVTPRDPWRTVLFLMMDHFGGFNTLVGCIASGGLAVCVPDRSPSAVCATIAASRATLLPATPTFLNLLAASGVYHDHDLSSIELVTYGTEVMAEQTLTRVRKAFPRARLKQTYGLSEVGVLRSQSESDESLFVRLGGDGFEVRVVEGVLWIRSHANMVGYVNAPSPFDDDGWMCTGDHVEVRGDYVRILGRKSDIINVGGQKVFPTEIESVLMEAPNVSEASAYGVAHPLLGSVVHARLTLEHPEDLRQLGIRLRRFCVERLAKYKVPVRFAVAEVGEQHSARFKKMRSGFSDA
jgi:acyl-CoA synthetase (AMP-forming)/AMP-acid ligase II